MIIHSARDLAHGLDDRLRLGLTARPWNVHSPNDTFWWLVPATDWPAYRYGKLAFSSARDVPRKDLLSTNSPALAPSTLFVGFNVEKGYGPNAKFVNPALARKPAQIVDPTWLWFEVMSSSGSRMFSRTLDAISAAAELYIYVVVGPVHDRDSGVSGQRDAVMFRCEGSGLAKIADNGLPINQLGPASSSATFVDLAGHLLPMDEFHWADVYAGTHVPTGDVDVEDLHDRVTSHFETWLR